MARALTDTFAGIAPASVPAYIGAQLEGTVADVTLLRLRSSLTDSETEGILDFKNIKAGMGRGDGDVFQ
jgi:hypothetical protein